MPGCAGEEEEARRPETIKSSQANAGLMRAGSQVRARGTPESAAVNCSSRLHRWEISFFLHPTRIFSNFLPPEICLIMFQSKNEMSIVYFGIAIKGNVGVTAFTFTQLYLFNSQVQNTDVQM